MSDILNGKRAPASLDRLLWLAQALMNFQDGQEVEPPERRSPADLGPRRQLWDVIEDARDAERAARNAEPEPAAPQSHATSNYYGGPGGGMLGRGSFPSDYWLPKDGDQ
ncbi:hypothetical protein ABZY05_50710 [Streptomyces canus]|uniref:hypothetical protein n=1 Tax=Streptomyces canus TaxID=58343 RepID=UPI0033B89121